MSDAAKVLVGLLLGAALGLLLDALAPTTAQQAAAIAQPVGRLWLNALQMTIVPLVMGLLIVGVVQASDAAASGRIARRTLAWILGLATASALFTAVFAPFLLSFAPRSEALAQALQSFTGTVATPEGSVAASLAALVPTNAIAAAAQGAIVPLVVFTLLFAFSLTRISAERRAPVLALAQGVADAMIVIVHWVLKLGPVGVFALILPVTVQAGGSVLGALGVYVAVLIATYLAILLMLYIIAPLGGGEPLRRFASAILPAQVVAASTQSSLASLPAMLQAANERFRYPPQVGALVLPLAVSLFRIASPAQYLGVVSFIAWAYGVELDAATIATCVALSVVISFGSVGLPGQASFMGTNLPVVQAAGLPVEPLGLLLAVDLIPDVFATVGNVSADLTVASKVGTAEAREAG
jgi:Na+/H+-dicarboxylate symporter